MKNFFLLLVFGLVFALFGCGGGSDDGLNYSDADCSPEIAQVVGERGDPEEIRRYDTHNYHSHTYWYWQQGISVTFKWGSIVDGCEVSTYTFEPIR